MALALRSLALGIALLRSAEAMRLALRVAAMRAAFTLTALVTIAVGAGFLVAAGYMFAVTLVGPLYAALLVGGILILKSMVWLAMARLIVAR